MEKNLFHATERRIHEIVTSPESNMGKTFFYTTERRIHEVVAGLYETLGPRALNWVHSKCHHIVISDEGWEDLLGPEADRTAVHFRSAGKMWEVRASADLKFPAVALVF